MTTCSRAWLARPRREWPRWSHRQGSPRHRSCGRHRVSGGRFGEEGWHVVGTDRRDPKSTGGHDFIQADLSLPEQLEPIRDRIEELGQLDALTNNAAMQVERPLVETSPEEWDETMATNVRGPYLLIRSLHAFVVRARGAVVNVSSVHARATSPGLAAYAASKGALVALTRAAALELAEEGVRVNSVLPGAVDTPLLHRGLARLGDERQTLEAVASATPLGRVAAPAEIAEAVLFLADSSRSSFITGQCLTVDGGALAGLSTEGSTRR